MTVLFNATPRFGGTAPVARFPVMGVGPVDFERPRLWYLGLKRWHVDFQFEANGVRYFGTVWTRGSEIELRAIYASGARAVAETAKGEWRAAIKRAAFPIIDQACKAYCEALDAENTSVANAIAAGRAPRVESPIEPTPVKTIKVDMTWQGAAQIIAMALESGTGTGKAMARAELLLMGQLLDSYTAKGAVAQ